MKKRNSWMFAALMGLLLIGCNKQTEEFEPGEQTPVRFSASITGASKATGTTWDDADQIGVYMKTAGQPLATSTICSEADNIPYLYSAGQLTCNKTAYTLYYPNEAAGGKFDFVAYYPWSDQANGSAADYSFVIDVSDQTLPQPIDLLYSNNATAKTRDDAQVALVFNHVMSKVRLNISAGIGFTGDLSDLSVSGVVPTSAKFHLADGTFSEVNEPCEIYIPTTRATGQNDYTAEAILIPHAGIAGRNLFFEVGGERYSYSIGDAVAFKSGELHLFDVVVDKTGITVTSEGIVDWNVQTPIQGDPAEELFTPISIDGGYFAGSNATVTFMDASPIEITFNASGVFQLSANSKTIRSIQKVGGPEIFVGRKNNGEAITLLTDAMGTVQLRPAINGSIPIGTFAELEQVRSHTSQDVFLQTSDIDLMNRPFTPVSVSTAFYGTYDGANHQLSNMNIQSSSSSMVGLFGILYTGAQVSNLEINSGATQGNQCVGAICGENYGTLSRVTNRASVSGNESVAGLCGINYGTIEYCYNYADITGRDTEVGGITAQNTGKILYCFNYGAIQGRIDVGGITGRSSGDITSAFNYGKVQGNENIGGISGSHLDKIISSCVNYAPIQGGQIAGGIVGVNNSTLRYCSNEGDVSGTFEMRGIFGANSGVIIKCLDKGVLINIGQP